MSAERIIRDLARRGVTLAVVDQKLRYRAPRGVLTDADRAALARDKPALLALLATEPDARPVVLPLDVWSDDDARALIAAGLRRVDAAWGAIPAEGRTTELAAVQAQLLDDLADIEAARQARDMTALRMALGRWEAAAAPIFVAYRAARLPNGPRLPPGFTHWCPGDHPFPVPLPARVERCTRCVQIWRLPDAPPTHGHLANGGAHP